MQPVARAHAAEPVAAEQHAYRWWVLGITSLGALLSSLNSGTLVIALPDILRDLHTDLFALLWIVVGYTLVATVLVLNAGRLADMVGRARTLRRRSRDLHRRVARSARSRPTAGLLIVGRVIQGVGGALIMATSAALVTDAFPRRRAGPGARHQRDGRSGRG